MSQRKREFLQVFFHIGLFLFSHFKCTSSFGEFSLSEFPKFLLRMVTNLTWLGISLVMVVEQSVGAGFNRFIAKYIELSFDLPSSKANVITGLSPQVFFFTKICLGPRPARCPWRTVLRCNAP